MDIAYRLSRPEEGADLAHLRLESLREQGLRSNPELLEALEHYFYAHGMAYHWVAMDTRLLLVAGMASVVIQYGLPTQKNLSGKQALFCGMYVRPEYRRQGIARHLLALQEQTAKDCACGRMYAYCNEASSVLLLTSGYVFSTHSGREVGKYAESEDNQTAANSQQA